MKIICIARNYVKHAKEFDNQVPDEPIFFLKPDTALIQNNQPFFHPDFSDDVHYELEVVVRIVRLGKNIEEQFAHRYYKDISLGIDFTARDLQRKCMASGNPWVIAKGFDGSAPLGPFVPIEKIPVRNSIKFQLYKNDQLVQDGDTANMIFSIDKLIAHISKFITLKIGDLIFTGTPEGVGPVKPGDVLKAVLEGNTILETAIK